MLSVAVLGAVTLNACRQPSSQPGAAAPAISPAAAPFSPDAVISSQKAHRAVTGDSSARKLANSTAFPKSSAAGDKRLAPARAALVSGDYALAFRLCEQARRENAPRTETLALRADIFQVTNYLDKEMETLREWCQAAPRDYSPWLRRFYIYLDLGWRREAAEASRHASQIAASEPRCLVARVLLAYRSPNPADGLIPMELARKNDPNDSALANLHASLLLKLFRFADAEAIARAALTRDPAQVDNRLALGAALFGEKKYAEATAAFQEARVAAPQNMEAQYQLGLLAQKQGNAAEAIGLLEAVASQDIGYSKTAFYLGNLYRQQGRMGEGDRLLALYKTMDANADAYVTLLKRLESRADDPDIHARLAQNHAENDELAQAVVEWRRVLQLRPADKRARAALADVLQRSGRQTEARRLRASAPRS